LLPLACPAEFLLTRGGDDRLHLDEATGLNGYGCSPKPRPWAITFSSTTASSISDYAYFAVEQWRQSAIRAGLAGDYEQFLIDESERIRSAIGNELKLGRRTEILLSSSGTTAEFLALWLAMPRSESGKFVNVIVGPAEVGSGTVAAGGGQHFNSTAPSGDAVDAGTPLDGMPSGNIRIEEVAIRDERGVPLEPEALERRLERVVQTARQESVLLHLLDASKTGLCVPDLDSADRLARRHSNIIAVIVDAAQMRLSRSRLDQYLSRGFFVIVTGSKFFTGPPFSAALLIPADAASHLKLPPQPMPAGFAGYATRRDLPPGLARYGDALPTGPDLGLLARWVAALWEMSAFHAIPPAARVATIAAFEQRVRGTIDRLDNLELVCAPTRRVEDGDGEKSWDEWATIFTYLILKDDGERRPLEPAEGRRAYHWLNSDISGLLPEYAGNDDRRLAATCCHTGQPVELASGPDGRHIAGMRVAAGARLVSGVLLDPMLGGSESERLGTELDGAETTLRKAALVGRYWSALVAASATEYLREQPDG
jgi:hypothetical protein